MNAEIKKVYFVTKRTDSEKTQVDGPLFMEVLLKPEIPDDGSASKNIYGYATHSNAGMYVANNRYPIEWDSCNKRYVVILPSEQLVIFWSFSCCHLTVFAGRQADTFKPVVVEANTGDFLEIIPFLHC